MYYLVSFKFCIHTGEGTGNLQVRAYIIWLLTSKRDS